MTVTTILLVLLSTVQYEADLLNRKQALDGLAEFYIRTGVLTESERRHFFQHPHQIEIDLEVMQDREKRMTLDTPAGDYVLPPADHCSTNWVTARTFVNYLQKRLDENLEPAHDNDLQLILWDAKWRLGVWDCLSDCHANWRDRSGKRLRLQRVRQLIGTEAFDRRQFPAPLPNAAHNSRWEPIDIPYLP